MARVEQRRTPVSAPPSYLIRRARVALVKAFGDGPEAEAAWAPGRCTLVGEHVDYAGGLVLAAAIDLDVAVVVRAGASTRDRLADRDPSEHEVGAPLQPAGGGYVFAAAEALRRRGHPVPPFDVATSATLPAGAGLSSSAAVICATIVALLRLQHASLSGAELVDAAYDAEHDVLQVPCGRLDQHTIVESPDHGAVLLDCAADRTSPIPWRLSHAVLCVCETGERRQVAGTAYRARRAETEAALRRAGVSSAQQMAFAQPIAADGALSPPPDRASADRATPDDILAQRLRHVVSETRRAAEAAAALRAGDASLLGRLMSESHQSLREDHEVSTPVLDSVVAAATQVAGCQGARMVGAGFGGSVVALADAAAARACGDAMRQAAGPSSTTWVTRPAPGVAATAGETVTRR